jgi:hypothetical protein
VFRNTLCFVGKLIWLSTYTITLHYSKTISYLNDVDEGGETNFPKMNITIQPKRGRAVLWPSVFDADPMSNDVRSDHQALPVIKGVKYGVNAWIHQGNVKDAPSDCS